MDNKLFSIGEAIKTGWKKAKGNIGSFFLIILATWIISGIINALAGSMEDAAILSMLISLVGVLVGMFLQMGITRVALKVLDGGKAAVSDFATNPEQFGKFLLGSILSGLIILVGFVLLIIPGIILSIRLQLVPYLIVEKNLGPMEAVKRSWAISRGLTWQLFLFGLAGVLVVLLGMVALLVGIFWAIPTVLVAVAFVYRKLENAPVATSAPTVRAWRSRAMRAGKKFIVGIDEVGRGPLAGPVVVAAVLLQARSSLARRRLRDSKQLNEGARTKWAAYVSSHAHIKFALASVQPRVIDRINISRAANLAALRAFRRLAADHELTAENCSVYLDGGLYLGNGAGRLPARTVIKGDEKIGAIALASIVAKVHRDSLMVRHAKKFPGYGFELHKGYGTELHRKALRRLGPTLAHRLTFLGKWNSMDRKHSHGRRTNKTSYTR